MILLSERSSGHNRASKSQSALANDEVAAMLARCIRCMLFTTIVSLFAWGGCLSSVRGVEAVSTFPISPYPGNLLTLPVSLEGTEYSFALDSGASLHGFDSDLRRFLGDPLATQTGREDRKIKQNDGSEIDIEEFNAPTATVGRLSLGLEAPVGCTDLSMLREANCCNIRGILGMPFFAAHVIQLDFENNEIRIFSGGTEPQEEWGEPVSVVISQSNLPIVFARAADSAVDEPFILDSGSNGSIGLRRELYDYFAQQGAIAQSHSVDTALVNKVIKNSAGRLSTFTFADYAHKDLNVSSGDQMSRIGLHYLRRYLVTFDLGRMRLFLKPNSHFHRPDRKPLLGMSALRKKGKTLIISVDDDMPAAKAGLQVNDELLSIGGVPITNQSIGEMLELSRTEVAPNGNLPILVERQGKTHSIMLRNLEPDVVP